MPGQRPDKADAELAGVLPRVVDDFLRRLEGAVLAHGDALGIVDHLTDVLEAVGGILGVLGQRLHDEVRDVQAADGVAVGPGLGDFGKADDPARAGLVDEDPGLRSVFVPVFLHDPGLHVARTARGEGDDHIDRLFGVGGCGGGRQRGGETEDRKKARQQFHGGSPWMRWIIRLI